MTTWIVFALIAALAWTIVNLADKYIIGHECRDPLIATATLSVINLAVFSGAALFSNTPILGKPTLIFFGLIIGALVTGTNYLYYQSLSNGDVSKAVPIFSTTPLFTLLLSAVFLNETLGVSGYVGVFLITIGAITISMKYGNHRLRMEPAILFAIGVAAASALRAVLFKGASIHGSLWELLFWIGLGAFITAIPLILLHIQEFNRFKENLFRKGFEHFLLVDTGNSLGFIALFIALASGPATLVTAILHVKPLLVFLLALFIDARWPSFLQEKMTKQIVLQKTIGTILIIVGVFFIAQL